MLHHSSERRSCSGRDSCKRLYGSCRCRLKFGKRLFPRTTKAVCLFLRLLRIVASVAQRFSQTVHLLFETSGLLFRFGKLRRQLLCLFRCFAGLLHRLIKLLCQVVDFFARRLVLFAQAIDFVAQGL